MSSPTAVPAKETMPRDHRWLALLVLCTGMLMIVLDVTVVNVALPSIQTDLHFSSSALSWVMNAYLIAFGGLLLLAGRLGDLLSRRGVFLAGLALFTAASAACGLASSQAMLIVARFIQGVGGALTSAVILGMIVTMFSEPSEQAKAIGVYGFVASAGGSIGLLVGGVITQSIDWHWIFFINIPIGIVTAAAAVRLLERDSGLGVGSGADLPGAVLITASLMLGVYTIVEPAAQHGWGYSTTLLLAGASLALLAAFVLREARAPTPLIPLRIFTSRSLAGANLIQALSVAGMFGMFFLGSLYLQRVRHYDPLQIGVAFLPATALMGTLSLRYSERIIMRFGASRAVLPGLTAVAVGLLLLTGLPAHGGSYAADLLPTLVLLGAGAGSSFPALMTLAMSDTGPSEAGLASGLVNTSAQVGGALGLAVLATLAAARTHTLISQGHAPVSALTSGYHLGFLVAAALVFASVIVAGGLLVLGRSRVSVSAGALERSGGDAETAPAPAAP